MVHLISFNQTKECENLLSRNEIAISIILLSVFTDSLFNSLAIAYEKISKNYFLSQFKIFCFKKIKGFLYLRNLKFSQSKTI